MTGFKLRTCGVGSDRSSNCTLLLLKQTSHFHLLISLEAIRGLLYKTFLLCKLRLVGRNLWVKFTDLWFEGSWRFYGIDYILLRVTLILVLFEEDQKCGQRMSNKKEVEELNNQSWLINTKSSSDIVVRAIESV